MSDPGTAAARPAAIDGRRDAARPRWRPLSLVRLWLKRMRDRRMLAGLSDHQLRDVGLDPLEIRREAVKPFWMR